MHAALTLGALLATCLTPPPPRAAAPRPLVFVLDGAGKLCGCSEAIARTAQADQTPIDVEVFVWSHGHYRFHADQTDAPYAREQGRLLAKVLAERRRQAPSRPIVLVGHSAGAAVALGAAEQAPPGVVDRVVLLAPSVSVGYDLRSALRGSRLGVDVFCSRRDVWALGAAVRIVGTADEARSGAAAGRFGFRPVVETAADAELYRVKLRQHFWGPEMARCGHDGGHYGTHAPGFHREYLFPLLFRETE